MTSSQDVLAELRTPQASLRNAIPDVWGAFVGLHGKAVADGAVPARLKEAAALAISAVKHCDGCIAHHARAAVRAGATREEAAEMLGLALLMDGGPATAYAPRAWQAFLEFSAADTDVRATR
ncbi:MAG: carboxymuconolactone decarboxylase family protein [Actinomycetota bacterium]